jgi:hypothetical protein
VRLFVGGLLVLILEAELMELHEIRRFEVEWGCPVIDEDIKYSVLSAPSKIAVLLSEATVCYFVNLDRLN